MIKYHWSQKFKPIRNDEFNYLTIILTLLILLLLLLLSLFFCFWNEGLLQTAAFLEVVHGAIGRFLRFYVYAHLM